METSAEWMLHKEVFQKVQEVLGPCLIHLFATRLNHQLPEFISWRPDPFAQGTDALLMDWKTLKGYAFPPFCLIGKCIQKIRVEECTIILVVPWWHSQAWFPALMENLVEPPLLLPRRRDLLKDPLNQSHPLVEQGHLKLVACTVSGDIKKQQEFQGKLQTSCWQVGAKGQTPLTNLDGQSGPFGVVNGKRILFHPESNHF